MKLFNSVWYHKINCHHKFYFRQKCEPSSSAPGPEPWRSDPRRIQYWQCCNVLARRRRRSINLSYSLRAPDWSIHIRHSGAATLSRGFHPHCQSTHIQRELVGHWSIWSYYFVQCSQLLQKCLASLQSVRFPNFPSLRTILCISQFWFLLKYQIEQHEL